MDIFLHWLAWSSALCHHTRTQPLPTSTTEKKHRHPRVNQPIRPAKPVARSAPCAGSKLLACEYVNFFWRFPHCRNSPSSVGCDTNSVYKTVTRFSSSSATQVESFSNRVWFHQKVTIHLIVTHLWTTEKKTISPHVNSRIPNNVLEFFVRICRLFRILEMNIVYLYKFHSKR